MTVLKEQALKRVAVSALSVGPGLGFMGFAGPLRPFLGWL